MKPNTSLIKSFGFAIEGIKLAYKYNRNIRIHTVIAIIAIILCFIFGLNNYETGIIIVAIALVICAEMVNTVIEEMVDLIIQEHREQARIAKDVGAGMVLVCSIGAVIIGVIVFIPHIINLIIK